MIFHCRDFGLTEKLDYFAAGASVLYGLYYTPIRIFRLDLPTRQNASLVRLWTGLCILLYAMHVSYLSFWTWDYGYNMTANVIIGVIQNVLWSGFSIYRYRKLGSLWAAWPGMIVAWIILAMSLELFDFAPWGGMVDAHSLWHLGTVIPTVWWYRYVAPVGHESHDGTKGLTSILQFPHERRPRRYGKLKTKEIEKKNISSASHTAQSLKFIGGPLTKAPSLIDRSR